MNNKKKLTSKQKIAITIIINVFVIISLLAAVIIGFVCFSNPGLDAYKEMKVADFIEMYENDERENKSYYKEDKKSYEFHRSTEAIAQMKSMNFVEELHFFNYHDDSFDTKLFLSSSQSQSSMSLYLSSSFDRAVLSRSGGDLLSAYSVSKYYKTNQEDGKKLAEIVEACRDSVTEWEEKTSDDSEVIYYYEKVS